MHLVDGHRRIVAVVRFPLSHPFCVAPFIGQIPDHRGSFGGNLSRERERIGLLHCSPAARRHQILVGIAGPGLRDEAFPDPGVARKQGVGPGVPLVEVPDDRDREGIRRPDGKVGATVANLGSHVFKEMSMGTFVEEVDVLISQQCDISHSAEASGPSHKKSPRCFHDRPLALQVPCSTGS